MVYEGPERRQYNRYDFEYPIVIKSLSDDSLVYKSTTINVSEKGLFCKVSDNKLNLFEKVKINVLVPVKDNSKYKIDELIIEGLIVRKEIRITKECSEYYVAIHFNNISEIDSKKITSISLGKDKSIIKKIINKASDYFNK